MKAWAWKRENEYNKTEYCIQVDNIKGKRKLNKVLKILSEWTVVGDGYNIKTKEFTYIFAKTFVNTHTWQTWAETFPIHLVEMTSHGNEKIRNKKMIQQGAVL